VKLSPLAQEFVAATIAIVALIVVLSLIYWAFTGQSPWPTFILAQAVVFGSGIGLLTLTSPRRRS
jgi:uncharacterized membrane protein YbhN (UPF0104 family)